MPDVDGVWVEFRAVYYKCNRCGLIGCVRKLLSDHFGSDRVVSGDILVYGQIAGEVQRFGFGFKVLVIRS